MKTYRREIAVLAAPGINAAREVYTGADCDVVRVAALVEIAAAASALARTVVKFRHLDPDLIAPYVADRADLRAVLGRGQWLPTMTRHVPEPPADACTPEAARRRPARRRAVGVAGQPGLFASSVEGGQPCL